MEVIGLRKQIYVQDIISCYMHCALFVCLTLQVSDEDTHKSAKNEIHQQDRHKCKRHADEGEQKVADGQVKEEDIGDSPHALVLDEGDNDEQVANQGQDEDERVEDDLDLRADPREIVSLCLVGEP